MPDLIPLTDMELAAVAGGDQSIYISADQSNSSYVTQYATATNSGNVTASAYGYGALAAAVGAEASNTALVYQANVISASNKKR